MAPEAIFRQQRWLVATCAPKKLKLPLGLRSIEEWSGLDPTGKFYDRKMKRFLKPFSCRFFGRCREFGKKAVLLECFIFLPHIFLSKQFVTVEEEGHRGKANEG